MIIFSVRSMTKRTLVACLLLMITSLTVSGVHAEMMYIYTYEGPTFEEGLETPNSPVRLGDSIFISFTTTALLPDGLQQVTAFTMTCGELTLTKADPPFGQVTVTGGAIVTWYFNVVSEEDNYNGYYEMTSYYSSSGTGYDRAEYHWVQSSDTTYRQVLLTAPNGWTQSAVPLPASSLLLGSGLLGLGAIGWRRKRG